MKQSKLILSAFLFLSFLCNGARGQQPQLKVLYQSPELINGLVTDNSGTMYAAYPKMEGGPGVRLARIRRGGKAEPYPSASWNGLGGETDPAKTFVRLNALRFGPDGLLWVVDTGAPTFDSPSEAGWREAGGH